MATPHNHAWLHEQLKAWASERLISAEQHALLASRYPLAPAGTPWGTVIFSCIGAVIAGLGVILLFAYNWDAIPKFGKLALILGVLVAAHAAGLALYFGKPRLKPLGEGICLLGSMLFGAGLWLVAQIYHIDEHFPTAFAVWSAGALLMALAMPSIPQAMLAAVLLTVWSGTERIGFDTPSLLAATAIVALLGPLTHALHSRLLAGVAIPAFIIAFAFGMPRGLDHPWLLMSTLLSLGALLVAASQASRWYGRFPGAGPVLAFYGWALYLFMLFLMSFPGMARECFRWDEARLNGPVLAYWLTPIALALAAWGVVIYQREGRHAPVGPGDLGAAIYLVPLTILLGLCDQFYLRHIGGWMVAGPFNLVMVGLAVTLMALGCRDGRLPPTVLGSVLLVALVAARYFDLFESLFVRGLLFVAMGAVIFTEGVLYTRARRRKPQRGAP